MTYDDPTTPEALDYIRRCLLDMGDPWENSNGLVCFNCNAWVSQCGCGNCDPVDLDELPRLEEVGNG